MNVMNVIGNSAWLQNWTSMVATSMTPGNSLATGAHDTSGQQNYCCSTEMITITLNVLGVMTLSLQLSNWWPTRQQDMVDRSQKQMRGTNRGKKQKNSETRRETKGTRGEQPQGPSPHSAVKTVSATPRNRKTWTTTSASTTHLYVPSANK